MDRNDWKIKRISIFYFPSREGSSHRDPRLSTDNYMFGEDVQHQIVPYSIEDSSLYSIGIDPDSPENRKLLTSIFSNESYPRIVRVVSEAIRHYASRLVWWGKIYYEIATVEAKNYKQQKSKRNSEPFVATFYKPVYIPGKVFSLGNRVIQVIPRPDRKNIGHSYITIPKSNVWILSIPPELGGVRGHKRLQRDLISASESIPKSLQDTNWLQEKRFNWGDYNKQRKLLAAKATSRWGWTGRALWNKDLLEYYILHRELRFGWSLAVLREYILGEMNKFLLNYGYAFQIKMTGFPKPHDFEEAKANFKEGKLTFKQAIEFSRLREKF